MKIKSKFLLLFFLILIFMYALTSSLLESQKELSNEILRLHIIANSNSDVDQEAKLLIRDKIIEFSKSTPKNNESKKEFLKSMEKDILNYNEIANSYLKELGLPYKATTSVEELFIPRKIYNGIVLPKGRYDALVIRLGEAKGENWWCVLYPPLCFTQNVVGELDSDGENYLKQVLSVNSFNLITDDKLSVKYEFYILELINSIKEKINPTKN